jgi:Na+-driven multidrug efflux pump
MAWINAAFVAACLQCLGLIVALWPQSWMRWFTHDPEVLNSGAAYFHWVGPTYGLMALTLELYFAGQGAAKIGWPLTATTMRTSAAVLALWCLTFDQVSLHVGLAVVAAGIAAAAGVSLIGFRLSRWGS